MPAKLDVFRAILMQGSVFVHLDARDDVMVPYNLQGQEQVVFQFGLDMPTPITDLEYNQSGVSGTLSFKGKPFHVSVPWESVFAIVGENNQGLVWHEDMPKSILERKEAEEAGKIVSIFKHEPSGKSKPKVASKEGADRSHLRLVK